MYVIVDIFEYSKTVLLYEDEDGSTLINEIAV